MKENKKTWLKRFGLVGFLFFLIKGIMWLVLGGSVLQWICNK